MKADSERSSEQGATPAPSELKRSAARCRAIADHLRDGLVQDLAAEVLRLGAAGLDGVADAERETLQARALLVGRCAHVLVGVADRLESIGEWRDPSQEGRGERRGKP